jgi:hypothetical protein
MHLYTMIPNFYVELYHLCGYLQEGKKMGHYFSFGAVGKLFYFNFI